MVIAKQTQDDITECLYSSSNIIASKYNSKTKKLVLIFESGGQYLYEGVPKSDYEKFESSPSQGKAFYSYIKKHTGSKQPNVDPNEIKNEIKRLNK